MQSRLERKISWLIVVVAFRLEVLILSKFSDITELRNYRKCQSKVQNCSQPTRLPFHSGLDNGSDNLKFSLINFQSVANNKNNKWVSLESFIDSEKPDVIFGTETWLKPDIATTEFFPEGFTVYRRDRPHRNGGGVLIAVSNKHVSSDVSVPNTEAEQVYCKLHSNKGHILLGSFYRAPGDHAGVGLLHDTLTELTKTQNPQE